MLIFEPYQFLHFSTPFQMKQRFLTVALLAFGGFASAQSTFAPLNSDYYHLPDRYEIRSGRFAQGFYTSSKAYERKGIAELADTLLADSSAKWSAADRFNLQYLQNDNAEWSKTATPESKKAIFKTFYKRKADLFHYSDKDFDLHLNPVMYIQAGQDNDTDYKQYINTRGVEVRGTINNKVGFYSFVAENQARFAGYAADYINRIGAVPTEAFVKNFQGNSIGTGAPGYDFFTARGYLSVNPTKNINLQFGQDRHFIGNGYRSMILSDFATSYPFLKASTRIWKFQYTNLFAQMKTSSRIPGDELIPSKYMALHHLSLNVTKNFNIGVFESIMFGRGDSTQNGQFDWAYMNPIIFYRSIEQQQGSRDNAFLGLDFKWNFLKHGSLYGQLLLDEFKLDEVKAGNGWWGNKQSWQLGAKYIDAFGLRNLDLQAEVNMARPYTYAHKDSYGSYAHYNQALAHPLGANFREYIGILRYQPMGKLAITAKLIMSEYGEDNNTNFGGNILQSYQYNRQEYNNKIGQGIKAKQMFADFTVSYQLKHNLFLDVKAVYRDKKSDLESLSRQTTFLSGALRWNIAQRLHEF